MNQEKIEQARSLLLEIVNENFPDVDTRKGTVIYEYLVSILATGLAGINEEIDKFKSVNSLSAIATNNTIDDSTVDAILSNWFISRKSGTKAKGLIKIEFNTSRDYFLPANTLFLTDKKIPFVSTVDNTILAENLSVESVSTYSFIINIEAQEIGATSLVTDGTSFITSILPGNIVSITAVNDFFIGTDNESNIDLYNRAKSLITTRDLVSKKSITGFMLENFPEVKQIKVIGYNDREMQRDVNNIGLKTGGKVDILVRTPEVNSGIIEGTTDGTGKLIIDTNISPILRIQNYALKTIPGSLLSDFTITVQSTKIGLLDKWSRFSKYEKITLNTTKLNQDIIVYYNYIPLIDDIQILIDSSEIKNMAADNLVKCYMPCFLGFTINYSGTISDPNNVKKQISTYINNYDLDIFRVSKLIDNILNNTEIEYIELPLVLTGQYYLPNGNIFTVTSDNQISINENIDLGISNNTYRFYNLTSDIQLVQI